MPLHAGALAAIAVDIVASVTPKANNILIEFFSLSLGLTQYQHLLHCLPKNRLLRMLRMIFTLQDVYSRRHVGSGAGYKVHLHDEIFRYPDITSLSTETDFYPYLRFINETL